MNKRPTCDTPGCGRPIPVGGEGHPEICTACLSAKASLLREITMREMELEVRVQSSKAHLEAAERLAYALLRAKYG
jgi:hypothetical protein